MSSHNTLGRGLGSGLYSQADHYSTAMSDRLGFSCSGRPRSNDYHCNKDTRANLIIINSSSFMKLNSSSIKKKEHFWNGCFHFILQHNHLNSTAHWLCMNCEIGDVCVCFKIQVKCWMFMWTIMERRLWREVLRWHFTALFLHVRIPDGFSHDAVQDPHLTIICEARQIGSQSLTEPLSFLPGALPAQPFLMKHLTRWKTIYNSD